MSHHKLYFENLDSLRAIAAFSVLFFHLFMFMPPPQDSVYTFWSHVLGFNGKGGFYGVFFFFILSGFLITYLLFVEINLYNKINIRYFYIRRILRIWPLYFVVLAIGFSYCHIVTPHCNENANIWMYVFFLPNFDRIINGPPFSDILSVLWSIGVEEQFYLVWPLVFLVVRNKNHFFLLFATVAFLSELFFYMQEDWDIGYYHFLSCVRYLAFGSVLAHVCYFHLDYVKKVLKRVNTKLIAIIYLLSLLTLYYSDELIRFSNATKYISHFMPFVFFAFVIVEQNYSPNSFIKLGKLRILKWIGKFSYGIYLTHTILIYLIKNLSFFNESSFYWLNVVLVPLLTVIISYLSYTYYECYFLKFKSKFAR